MRTRVPSLVLTLVALLASPTLASADGLILESHVGERPADAERILRPVIAELASRGFADGDAARTKIVERLSAALPIAAAGVVEQAGKDAGRGYEAYIDGECDKAVPLLESAIRVFTQHALATRDARVRNEHYRALVSLAACHDMKRANEAASAAMAELLRTFPDRPVTTAEFAPRVAKLYHGVKATIARQGLGTMVIQVDESSPAIVVNERIVGTGTVTLRDLVPGAYRVYAEAGTDHGRMHVVTVHAGAEARLDIPWRLEAALRTDGFVGLSFSTAAAREASEAGLAARVARDVGAASVVVLTIAEVDQRRSVVGMVIDVATGSAQRRAVMALEPAEPPAAKLRLLGKYLSGIDVTDPLISTGETAPGAPRLEAGGTARRSLRRPIGIGVAAAGVAAMAVGGYFGVHAMQLKGDADEHCDDDWRCNATGYELEKDARSSANLSNAFLIGGALVAAGGAVLWWTAPSTAERATVAPVVSPDTVGVAMGGRF